MNGHCAGRCARGVVCSALFGLALMLTACGRSSGGSTALPLPTDQPEVEAISALPLGDVAGAAQNTASAKYPNPYANSPQAVQQGHDLYIKMNCAGCHGYKGGGGMGPNLSDGYWRYGGTPVALFKSLYEGRPQGMPAWNPALPPQEIWKIVAYLQSLGGTYAANEHQAWAQGDRPGENVPDEVKATLRTSSRAVQPSEPAGSSATPSTAPSNPDGSPPPDSQK